MNASPASAPCPKCGRRGNMQWQWKPDREPERERLRCYGCGWDTGWIRYGTCQVREAAEIVVNGVTVGYGLEGMAAAFSALLGDDA